MKLGRTFLILLINILFFTCALARSPHFYLRMANISSKDATVSFQPQVGNITLAPTLADQTPLKAQTQTRKYAVSITPLDPKATFDIVFRGSQDCAFNVAFYAPNNPKINVSGKGCYGGGYEVIENGSTLLLYITDINLKP